MQRRFAPFSRYAALMLALLMILSGADATLAAQQATPEPPPPPTATATTPGLSTDALESQAAPVGGFSVQVEQCTDAGRAGTTDFSFSGDISAAGELASDCAPLPQYINGAIVTVTIVSDTNAYVGYLDAFGSVSFDPGIEPGTYTLSIAAGEEYMAAMPQAIVLEPGISYNLQIVRFLTGGEPAGTNDPGTGTVSGTYIACIDPARAGTIDLLIDAVQGADVGSNCQPYEGGQAILHLHIADDNNGRTYDRDVLISPDGSFSFPMVGFGTGYTITDPTSGAVSEPFPVGGDVGANVNLTVYSYFAAEPVLLGTVNVTKIVCVDPDRSGDVEFVIDAPLTAAESCYRLNDAPLVPPISFTLTPATTGTAQSQPVALSNQQVTFTGLLPDTYTLNEFQAADPVIDADSEPFVLGNGQQIDIQVINYVDGEPTGGVPASTSGWVTGTVRHCTSTDRDGEVDFLINNPFVSGVDTGTSTCTLAQADQGVLTLSYFGNGATPSATPVQTFTTTTNANGYYSIGAGFLGGTLSPGWYQLALSDSSFSDQVYQSDVFTLAGGTIPFGNATTVDILAYVAPPEGSAYIDVWKSTCYDPAREGEVDFFINQFPPSDVGSAATSECVSGAYPIGTSLKFTLTDTATGESVDSSVINPIFIGSIRYRFLGIPAGTYTLTETITDLTGTRQVVSDAFSIDPAAGSYEMNVKNYTGTDVPTAPPSSVAILGLNAFTCANDARDGEYDYFKVPFSPLGLSQTAGDAEVSAAETSTNACQAATSADAFAFQLESVPSDASPPIIYPLVQNPDMPWQYVNGSGTPLPPGTYVIRETSRNLASDPVTLGGFGEDIEFYFYKAIPSLVAGNTSFTVDAGETYSGNLAPLVRGGVPPYTFSLAGAPAQGTVTINADGTFIYTANANAFGSDSFGYTVTDTRGSTEITSAASATGTVSVTIIAAATATATATTPGDATATATSPGDATATATSPGEATATATSPGDATATATSPAGVTPTSSTIATVPSGTIPATEPAGGIATRTPGLSNPDATGTSSVSSLPSTGQGTPAGSSWQTILLLLAGVALLLAAVVPGIKAKR